MSINKILLININSVPVAVRFRAEKNNNTFKYKLKKLKKLLISSPYQTIIKIWNYCFGAQDIFFKISRDSGLQKKICQGYIFISLFSY